MENQNLDADWWHFLKICQLYMDYNLIKNGEELWKWFFFFFFFGCFGYLPLNWIYFNYINFIYVLMVYTECEWDVNTLTSSLMYKTLLWLSG